MATANATAVSDTYFRLVREFPLVPIRSDAHLRRAHGMIDSLLGRKLDSGEEQYLAVLSDLVADYEDARHPVPPASNAEMLAHLLDARGVTQAALSRATAIPRSTLSEILHGKRSVSKRMIPKLSAYFNVEPAVWLGYVHFCPRTSSSSRRRKERQTFGATEMPRPGRNRNAV